MSGQHTPGPWYDDGYRIYAPTDDEDKRNGRMIVSYKHVDDFNPADAPLLTTSPKLLKALERLSAAALARDGTMGDQCRLIAVRAELANANTEACAVIAEARGWIVPPRVITPVEKQRDELLAALDRLVKEFGGPDPIFGRERNDIIAARALVEKVRSQL